MEPWASLFFRRESAPPCLLPVGEKPRPPCSLHGGRGSAFGIGAGIIGVIHQVIHTGVVKLCQLDQNFHGNVDISQLVVRI